MDIVKFLTGLSTVSFSLEKQKGTLKIISRLERKSERYVEAQNYANDIQAAS